MVKGFVLDDERLKKGGNIFGKEYFDELLERVQEKQQLKSLPRVRMPSIPQWAIDMEGVSKRGQDSA